MSFIFNFPLRMGMKGFYPYVLLFTASCIMSVRSHEDSSDIVMVESLLAQQRYEKSIDMIDNLMKEEKEATCPVLLYKARGLVGLGRYRDAIETIRILKNRCEDDPHISAQTLFFLGRWIAEYRKDLELAIRIFSNVVIKFPDEPSAKRAVTWIIEMASKKKKREEIIEILKGLYIKVKDKEVGSYVLFRIGQLLEKSDDVRDKWRRLAIYNLIIKDYKGSSLRDDAYIEGASLCMQLNMPMVAIKILKEYLLEREQSLYLVSYDTPSVQKAGFLLGEALYLGGYHCKKVADYFLWYVSEFDQGFYHPKALFKAYEGLKCAGEHTKALKVLRNLADKYSGTWEGQRALEIIHGN